MSGSVKKTFFAMVSSARPYIDAAVFNGICFSAWLLLFIVVGHVPIAIDLFRFMDADKSFELALSSVLPSIFLVYVVLVASNIYMIFSTADKVKAFLLLAVSVVWVILLLVFCLMFPFKGALANVFTGSVVLILVSIVSLFGISLTAFLTFVPFCDIARDTVAKKRRKAADAAVLRQELERTDGEQVEW